MRARLLLLPLAAALLSACASMQTRFVCPTQGGPAWREVTTDHFVIQTDVSSHEARRLAQDLEEMRASVLLALFKAPPPIPGRVRVVAFGTPQEYHRFAPPGALAYFTFSDLSEPLIVVSARWGSASEEVLAHELAHYVTFWVFPRQPRWFAEGTAALAEPLAEKGLQTRPTVGKIMGHRVAGARAVTVRARDLLAWDGAAHDSRYHDWSAVLVHYLMTQRAAGFVELQRRFARAQDPRTAWREVFPQWDPDVRGAVETLDGALRDWVANGRYAARVVDPKVTIAPAERALSPGEIHAIRLRLVRNQYTSAKHQREADAELAAEIAEALAEDPGQTAALRARTELEHGDAGAAARLAAERNPQDLQAWLWLASTLDGDANADARLAALRRAHAVAPENPTALNELAWELGTRDETAEALPLAQKAVALAPWSAAFVDTWAVLLAATGRCPEALAAAERSLELVPDGASEEARAPFRERIAKMRATCPVVAPAVAR